jgi:hypothetical protein
MKQILIGRSTVIYGYNSCDDVDEVYSALATGALVAFASDGTYLDGSTTELFKDFYFCLGTPEGAITTPLINYKTFAYKKTVYVAPVLPIIIVGAETGGNGVLNFPASLTSYIGKSASMLIIDKRKQPNDKSREHWYTVPITSVSTNLTILTALVAAINADTNHICTAAVAAGNAGIVLTALYGDMAYANMGGVFESTTLATSGGSFQAYVEGTGTYAEISQLEQDYSPLRGNINSNVLTTVLWSPTKMAVSGITYTVYSITWTSAQTQLDRNANFENNLLIAVASGDSALIAILDALFAVVNVAADAIE